MPLVPMSTCPFPLCLLLAIGMDQLHELRLSPRSYIYRRGPICVQGGNFWESRELVPSSMKLVNELGDKKRAWVHTETELFGWATATCEEELLYKEARNLIKSCFRGPRLHGISHKYHEMPVGLHAIDLPSKAVKHSGALGRRRNFQDRRKISTRQWWK